MYRFKLEKFEGPLDLLLNLIQDEKFDISEVSLAGVTDEYLKYIENNPEISPEELADFLVIATKLLLIKSKMLLPEIQLDEEDDVSSLAKQLKIYQEYLKAMQMIQGLINQRHFWYWRARPPVSLTPKFSPGSLTTGKLKEAFMEILKTLEKLVILPESVMAKTVSLQEKIRQIKDAIKSVATLNFNNLMSRAKSRTEVIISFLALLELVKQQEIHVHQMDNFGDIVIKRAPKEVMAH